MPTAVHQQTAGRMAGPPGSCPIGTVCLGAEIIFYQPPPLVFPKSPGSISPEATIRIPTAQADTNCSHPIAPAMDDFGDSNAIADQYVGFNVSLLLLSSLLRYNLAQALGKSSGKLKARLTVTSKGEYRPLGSGGMIASSPSKSQPKFRWSLAELSTLTARSTYRFF
jgi:hypothetical protein